MAWRTRRQQIGNLAEGLIKAGGLQFGTFTLPSGKESSYYVNLKGIFSYPGLYRLAVDSMTRLLSSKTSRADAICGIPMNGLALAAPLAISQKKPLVYTVTSGRTGGRVVNGELRPGWDVVLVDDISTSGKTILSSARSIEEEGGEVKTAFVLIDRLEGAREKLAKEGIALQCLTDVLELADTLFSMELIKEEDLRSITKSVGRRQ